MKRGMKVTFELKYVACGYREKPLFDMDLAKARKITKGRFHSRS